MKVYTEVKHQPFFLFSPVKKNTEEKGSFFFQKSYCERLLNQCNLQLCRMNWILRTLPIKKLWITFEVAVETTFCFCPHLNSLRAFKKSGSFTSFFKGLLALALSARADV